MPSMFIYPCYQPNQWTRTDVDIFNSQVAAPVSGLKTRPCLTVFHSCKWSYVYCTYTFVYGLMTLSTTFIFKWIVFLSHALEWGSAAWEQSSAELEDGSLGDDESLLCSYINMFKHVKEGTTEKRDWGENVLKRISPADFEQPYQRHYFEHKQDVGKD